MGINAAARLLLERGLALEAEGGDLVDGRSGDFRLLGQVALANLTASEASLLILEKSLNVGYNRIDDVEALAAARARLRLRHLEEATEAEVLC